MFINFTLIHPKPSIHPSVCTLKLLTISLCNEPLYLPLHLSLPRSIFTSTPASFPPPPSVLPALSLLFPPSTSVLPPHIYKFAACHLFASDGKQIHVIRLSCLSRSFDANSNHSFHSLPELCVTSTAAAAAATADSVDDRSKLQ